VDERMTMTVTNGDYLVKGIQLSERLLTPKWFGRLIIWIFFHRLDTQNIVTLSGFAPTNPSYVHPSNGETFKNLERTPEIYP
jgi:hypothetical protein